MSLAYPVNDYKAFVRYQKQKGLLRKFWKDLPQMWRKELKFRRELEKALA